MFGESSDTAGREHGSEGADGGTLVSPVKRAGDASAGNAASAVVRRGVPGLAERGDLHDVARVRRVDELPAADVEPDVAETVEEDEVTGLKVVARHRDADVPLRAGVVRKADADLAVDVGDEPGAVEPAGARSAPDVRRARGSASRSRRRRRTATAARPNRPTSWPTRRPRCPAAQAPAAAAPWCSGPDAARLSASCRACCCARMRAISPLIDASRRCCLPSCEPIRAFAAARCRDELFLLVACMHERVLMLRSPGA